MNKDLARFKLMLLEKNLYKSLTRDPVLADRSSLAWEFSPNSNPLAFLVNLR